MPGVCCTRGLLGLETVVVSGQRLGPKVVGFGDLPWRSS